MELYSYGDGGQPWVYNRFSQKQPLMPEPGNPIPI
jgi:hypothetical protein